MILNFQHLPSKGLWVAAKHKGGKSGSENLQEAVGQVQELRPDKAEALIPLSSGPKRPGAHDHGAENILKYQIPSRPTPPSGQARRLMGAHQGKAAAVAGAIIQGLGVENEAGLGQAGCRGQGGPV